MRALNAQETALSWASSTRPGWKSGSACAEASIVQSTTRRETASSGGLERLALPCRMLGDVDHPQLVRTCRPQVTSHQVVDSRRRLGLRAESARGG